MKNEEKILNSKENNYGNIRPYYVEKLEKFGIKDVESYSCGKYLKFSIATLTELTKFTESEIESSIKSLLNGKTYVQNNVQTDKKVNGGIKKGKIEFLLDGVTNFVTGKINYECRKDEYLITPSGLVKVLEKLKEAKMSKVPYELELARINEIETKLKLQILEIELMDSEIKGKEFACIEDEKGLEILKMLVNGETNTELLDVRLKQYWVVRNERANISTAIKVEREKIKNFKQKNAKKVVDNYLNTIVDELTSKKDELAQEKEILTQKIQCGLNNIAIKKIKELYADIDELHIEHHCLITYNENRLKENDKERALLISEFKQIGEQLLLIEFEILKKEYELKELEKQSEKMSIGTMNKKLPLIEQLEMLKIDMDKNIALKDEKINYISQIGSQAYEKMQNEEIEKINEELQPLNIDDELNGFRSKTWDKSRQILLNIGELNPYIDLYDNLIIDNRYYENIDMVYSKILDEIVNLKINELDEIAPQEKIQYIENIILLWKNYIVEWENETKVKEPVLVAKKIEYKQLISEKMVIESQLLTMEEEYKQELKRCNKKRKQKKVTIRVPKIVLIIILVIYAVILGLVLLLVFIGLAIVVGIVYCIFIAPFRTDVVRIKN